MTDRANIDTHSETWRGIRKHIEERLQLNRDKIDSIGLPMAETEAARGAIQELKELLELEKPPAIVPVSDDLGQMGGMI